MGVKSARRAGFSCYKICGKKSARRADFLGVVKLQENLNILKVNIKYNPGSKHDYYKRQGVLPSLLML